LFRHGKALISREVAAIFERIGTDADTWQARLEKPGEGRLLGRFFAASPGAPGLREVAGQLGLRRAVNLARVAWSPEACTKPFCRPDFRFRPLSTLALFAIGSYWRRAMIELNTEQRQAMAQGQPVRIVDPETNVRKLKAEPDGIPPWGPFKGDCFSQS
jgi:hypothetical protein